MVIVEKQGRKKARRDRGNASHSKSPMIFASLPPILGPQDSHEQPIMDARILFLYATCGKHFFEFIPGRWRELHLKGYGP